MQILTNRFGTEEKLQASCDLVAHPRGAFTINGKRYCPQWGRSPTDNAEKYGKFYDDSRKNIELAVAEANKVCNGKDPKLVRLLMYEDGRTLIIVRE